MLYTTQLFICNIIHTSNTKWATTIAFLYISAYIDSYMHIYVYIHIYSLFENHYFFNVIVIRIVIISINEKDFKRNNNFSREQVWFIGSIWVGKEKDMMLTFSFTISCCLLILGVFACFCIRAFKYAIYLLGWDNSFLKCKHLTWWNFLLSLLSLCPISLCVLCVHINWILGSLILIHYFSIDPFFHSVKNYSVSRSF